MANVHIGALLEKIVKGSDISVEALTRKLNYSRTTYYNHIRNKDLPLDILMRYGRVLGYDFSQDIPEMAEMENALNTRPLSIEEAVRQRETWRTRYYDLLERFNTYLEGTIILNPTPSGAPKLPGGPKAIEPPETPEPPRNPKPVKDPKRGPASKPRKSAQPAGGQKPGKKRK